MSDEFSFSVLQISVIQTEEYRLHESNHQRLNWLVMTLAKSVCQGTSMVSVSNHLNCIVLRSDFVFHPCLVES